MTTRRNRRPVRGARTALAAALTACTVPAVGHAGEDMPVGFQSPSGDIHCLLVEAPDRPAWLRCDMRRIDGPPPARPANCPLDWGLAFALPEGRASGERICVADTVVSAQWPVLGYGHVWRIADITCAVAETGLTCTNRHGHGFFLSRTRQRLF
jgi:hypothetical protein